MESLWKIWGTTNHISEDQPTGNTADCVDGAPNRVHSFVVCAAQEEDGKGLLMQEIGCMFRTNGRHWEMSETQTLEIVRMYPDQIRCREMRNGPLEIQIRGIELWVGCLGSLESILKAAFTFFVCKFQKTNFGLLARNFEEMLEKFGKILNNLQKILKHFGKAEQLLATFREILEIFSGNATEFRRLWNDFVAVFKIREM